MPTFAYRAVDATGRRSRGRLTAATEAAVTQALETRGLLALEVRESAEVTAGGGFSPGRRRAVLEFTRAVAALLPAGMPLSRALSAAVTSLPESARPAFDAVRARVDRGDELHASLAAYPSHFSPLYIGVVRAGEKSGALDDAFARLATHLERDQELRSKLVSMSIYPAMLALVGIASVAVLVLFVLPRFADLLLGAGAALPRSTELILSMATTAQEQWRLLLLVPLALVLWMAWLRLTDAGRRVAAATLVHTPLFGGWRRQALGASFARMVGELTAGGAPLLAALADARDCMADPVARDETDRIRTRVREGGSLNAAIAEGGLFPPVLAQLVALGEDAGRLSEFLLKAAELLERRTERAVERLVALAEPAMIIIFGGIVALVALALLQAIYGVNAGSFR
ncbi:MAG TPA: type II secretion system F family protein [Longimicrobiales bacterium]|nr:type II secretion system F family protein [Longimicrobiales bacterium]